MSRAKIVLKVDPTRTATDAFVEQLLRKVVGVLVPHLQEQVGAVDHRQADKSGTTWTTEGWLEDGAYVSLSVGVGSGEVTLFVDTSPVLKPAKRASTVQKIGLATASAGAALASWWHFRTLGSILGGVVVGLVLGTAVEILLTIRKERVAAARTVDEEDWRKRLLAAAA